MSGLIQRFFVFSAGFCDQFYLSRKFKAIEGITPTAYRGKLRNQP